MTSEPRDLESVQAISRRTRQLLLGVTLALTCLAAATLAILVERTRGSLLREAEAEAAHWEREVASAADALQGGFALAQAPVSRFSVDARGIVIKARPAWLVGTDLRGGLLLRSGQDLAPGQYSLTIRPDYADMAHRAALLVATRAGYEVATFEPFALLRGSAGSARALVINADSRCLYSAERRELGEEIPTAPLSWREGRCFLTVVIPLERTASLSLVSVLDVTQEASWLFVCALVGALALFLVRGHIRRLGGELRALEEEVETVGHLIATMANLPPFPERGDTLGRLGEALSAQLEAARSLELRFVESRAQVEVLRRLGENALLLLDGLSRETEQSRASELRLRSALTMAPLPVLLHADDGEVLLVNERWLALSGCRADQLTSLVAWRSLAWGEGAEGAPRWLEHEGSAPELESTPAELSLRSADGRELVWAFNSAHLGALADGRQAAVTMATDLTERRELELDLRQTDKLRAIGQLAGGVAHDFNNNLTGILGYAELLARSAPQLSEYVEPIQRAALRSADLTKQLLAFARKGKHRAEPTDLHALLSELSTFLKRSISGPIEILLQLEAEHPWVAGDPTQLHSAFLNLGLNARDAMSPEGGTLTIATRDAELSPGVPALELRFSDTGAGVPAAIQERIFEPFFTTKPEGLGTGMGLAAVYGTVEAHGGQISLTSPAQGGALFTILLPAAGSGPEADAPSALSPSPAPEGPRRVLIVDDEPLVLRLLEAQLGNLGHEVRALASGGGEALAAFGEDPDGFDLVLLDLGLPDLSGPQVFRRLRAIRPKLSIVIASGFALNEEAQSLIDLGAASFLPKPFTLSELQTALADALGLQQTV